MEFPALKCILLPTHIRRSFLLGVLVCFFLSHKAFAQSDREIIASCERIANEAKNLNSIDKQMCYLDTQRQVEALRTVAQEHTLEVWKSYYFQLYSLLVYFDPSKSMIQYRPYMVALDKLIHNLPPNHNLLKWFAIKRLSRLYAFYNDQERACELLEETIRDVIQKTDRDGQDSLYLTKAMVGQLYCYNVVTKAQADRNQRFLEKYTVYTKGHLGLALYNKNYMYVIKRCEAILDKGNLELLETCYISHLMEDALQHVPRNKERALYMIRLATEQKRRYAEIQKSTHSEYQIYQDWQTKKREEEELKQQLQAEEIHYVRWGIILGLAILCLVTMLWFIYKHQMNFSESILRRVSVEREKHEATLNESKLAYDKQLQLVRNLNHDIRIPLNALIGFSTLLSSEEDLTAETVEVAGQTIRKSNTQLLHMINNLLAIARLETDNMSLHMRDHVVNEVVRPEYWCDLIEQLQPCHSVSIHPEESELELETDLGHVRCIIELFINDLTRQMASGFVLVSSHVDFAINELCVGAQAPKEYLNLEAMQDALDTSKGMSAYEDASSYYLVRARMVAQLIGGRVELDSIAGTLHLKLWLPLK